MRAVRSTDTGPELLVRRITHRLGFRYRLHRRDLPGKPDLVFPGLRKIIFVHGCFWHGHGCKRGNRQPVANAEYWREKLARNVSRDERHLGELKEAGWSVLVLWECETKDSAAIERRVKQFLDTH